MATNLHELDEQKRQHLEFSRFFEKISEWATIDIYGVVFDAESDGGKKNPKK